MKTGQLDGALLTAVGLSRIYLPILVLQLPGLFKNWTKLNGARQVMDSEFQRGMNNASLTFLGWSDFGAVRLLSKGLVVKIPNDMRGKKPFVDVNNQIDRALYQFIGNCTPVPINIHEVLPRLNMGAIDTVLAPSIVAEQLQWASKFNKISADVNSLATGGLVIASPKFNGLSADLRAILLDTSKVAMESLTKRIQDDDNSVFSRLQTRMQVITLTAGEQSQWSTTYREVRRVLAQGVFSASLVARIEQLAN